MLAAGLVDGGGKFSGAIYQSAVPIVSHSTLPLLCSVDQVWLSSGRKVSTELESGGNKKDIKTMEEADTYARSTKASVRSYMTSSY